MKAGKKIASGAQQRSIHHVNATAAKNKKTGASVEPKAFKAPGSRNKKKCGGC